MRTTSQGMRPFQHGKTRKIPIRRDPFTTVLYGKRGMPCIRNQFTLRGERQAELLENLPIPLPGPQHYGLWPAPERMAKFQGDCRWSRLLKNLGIRHNPHKPAEHRFRKAESGRSLRKLPNERGIGFMFAAFLPMCVDQDIHIAELHGERSP